MKKLIVLAVVAGLGARAVWGGIAPQAFTVAENGVLQADVNWPHDFVTRPAKKAAAPKLEWHDCAAPAALEGRAFPNEAPPYERLPARLKDRVTPKVWNLSHTTIGFNARFVTDSDVLSVRWDYATPPARPLLNQTPMMQCGIDVYARSPNGAWRHVRGAAPDAGTGVGLLTLAWKPGDEALVYLPVRASPKTFAIGVKSGASFAKPRPHAVPKPIVIYGTSIVNGGAASRPGLIFTSIMGRRVDAEVINLGFSGAARMERPMADLVAEIDASVYIVDCDHNMSAATVRTNYEPFIRRLKELRPNTPVLVCGGCTETAEPYETERVARPVFDRVTKEDPVKWANWHYLSGVDQLPKTDDCTHDHCHPNDCGFVYMGRVYAEKVSEILSSSR